MTIHVPQNSLRIAARSLSEFTGPVAKFGAIATAGLIETVAKEMRVLADTQATTGLHANAINTCRVQTCLENLHAATPGIMDPPFSDDDGERVVDEARDLLTRIHDDLLSYDDELKAA